MKYIKTNFWTKLIASALSLSLLLALCACDNGETEVSSAPDSNTVSEEESFTLPEFSEESLPPDDGVLSKEEAVALLEADKLVTEMFINHSLCEDGVFTAEYQPLPIESEYVNFESIKSLLNNTYSAQGGCIEEFLSYPQGLPPSVTEKNGRTQVFRHPFETYDDPVYPSTASVADTENENEKFITATTRYSNTVTFKAVLENGKWRLHEGIYRIQPIEGDEFTKKFPLSDIGSFKSLSGSLLVIEFFVSDNSSEFTYEEEQEFHGRISTAVEYLVDSAEEYQKTVTPTYKKAYFDHDGVIGSRPLDFDIVFADTGFGTLNAFAEANYDLSQYDNYVFVVCLDKNVSASYNAYANTDQTRIYYGERAIIGNETPASELCVSLFGLLGAYSYNAGLCDEYTEALYRSYFPNDIMVNESLAHSKLSPVTAYACGLTESLDRFCGIFHYEQ